MTDKIVILDFGSQYTQLIARRLRELNVYCEIYPYNKFPAADPQVKAVVLSGSPFSVLQEESLEVDLSQILGKYPTLGVCYGAQYIAHTQGGKVAKSAKREYGKAMLEVVMPDDHMMLGISNPTQVWMSHGDSIIELPDGFELVACTADIPVAAYRSAAGRYNEPVLHIFR